MVEILQSLNNNKPLLLHGQQKSAVTGQLRRHCVHGVLYCTVNSHRGTSANSLRPCGNYTCGQHLASERASERERVNFARRRLRLRDSRVLVD